MDLFGPSFVLLEDFYFIKINELIDGRDKEIIWDTSTAY